MANISYLLRPDPTDLDDPYHPFFYSSPIPVARSSDEDLPSDPESVVLDRRSQAAFVMDLLNDRVESSSSPTRRVYRGGDDDELGFGIVDGDPDRFDLGLGFREFGNELYNGEEEEDEEDGFFVQRRVSAAEDEDDEEARSGVRVVGGMSDSEIEDDDEATVNLEEEGDSYLNDVEFYGGSYGEEDDVSVEIPLCWDSLRLEDNEEDFGWEEVDARVDERELMSVFVGEAEYEEEEHVGRGEMDDEDEGLSLSLSVGPIVAAEDLVSVESIGGGIVVEGGGGEEVGGVLGNVEWEVLLNASNFISGAEDHELDHPLGTYFGDHNNDYVYPAEYEALFGQFVENENVLIAGKPPASKRVVENLLCVSVSKEDVDGDNALCAVCKDGFNVGEQVKQLPCSHRYHGDCIVPWLGIRNTCPVCRYEFPTDDPDYERRQASATQRGA